MADTMMSRLHLNKCIESVNTYNPMEIVDSFAVNVLMLPDYQYAFPNWMTIEVAKTQKISPRITDEHGLVEISG